LRRQAQGNLASSVLMNALVRDARCSACFSASVEPGQRLFAVIPLAPNSFAIVRTSLVTAAQALARRHDRRIRLQTQIHLLGGASGSPTLTPEISFLFSNPVFPPRRKDIQIYSLFKCFGSMRHIRGNEQQLPCADDHFAVIEDELQRAAQDQRKLLADMRVPRHDCAASQQDSRDRRMRTAYHLACDRFSEALRFDLFPRCDLQGSPPAAGHVSQHLILHRNASTVNGGDSVCPGEPPRLRFFEGAGRLRAWRHCRISVGCPGGPMWSSASRWPVGACSARMRAGGSFSGSCLAARSSVKGVLACARPAG